MSIRRTASGVVGLALTAVSVSVPAAADAPAPDALAKSCGFEFTWTQPTVLPAQAQILGRGFAQCDVRPDEHVLTLGLEYKQGDKWVNAASITDRTPPPVPLGVQTYDVSAACYSGTWRISVGVTGSLQGVPFVFSDHSRERDVPTSQCPSR